MTNFDFFTKLIHYRRSGERIQCWAPIIEIYANDTWENPIYPKRTQRRTLSAIIAEGIAGCIMGEASKCSRPVGTVVSAEISGKFYSLLSRYGNGTNILSISEDSSSVTVYSERKSSSTTNPNEGKTEPGICITMMLSALWQYINGNDNPIFLLQSYLNLCKEISAISISRRLPEVFIIPPNIDLLAKDKIKSSLYNCADSMYHYMGYAQSPAQTPINSTKRKWDLRFEKQPRNINWTSGAHDLASSLSNPNLFEEILNQRKWPIKPSPNISISSMASFNLKSNLVTVAAKIPSKDGGTMPVVYQGPPGGGKTMAIRQANDGIPLVRRTITRDMPMYLLVGSYERDGNNFVPRLGPLALTVRYAMLRSLLIALSRGAEIFDTLGRYKGHAASELLSRLNLPTHNDKDIQELDSIAWPYISNVWEIIESAYFESKAYSIGPVVRFFLDEIYDCIGNRELITILKTILSDEHRLVMSQGGANWMDIFAYNVHFTAAGNPATALGSGDNLDNALRSRFAFTVSIDYPSEITEIDWIMQSAGAFEPAKPNNLKLIDAIYDPPVLSSPRICDKVAKMAAEYTRWSRTAVMIGKSSTAAINQQCLSQPLDPRVSGQIATVTQCLVDRGASLLEAFVQTIDVMIDRFLPLTDEGIPLDQQREAAISKAEAIAKA